MTLACGCFWFPHLDQISPRPRVVPSPKGQLPRTGRGCLLSDPKSGPAAELSPPEASVFREGCLLGKEISRRPRWLSTMQGPHLAFGGCRGLTYSLRPHSWSRAAAAAKSFQSCPTLCDPIDGSPPGSSVPGILQARVLEWVAISFSSQVQHQDLNSDLLTHTPPPSLILFQLHMLIYLFFK